MIDFTNCKTRKKAYGGANGTKRCIVYHDENYMLKLSSHPTRKTALSYTNSCISEYIGCHVYEMLGISVQETILGTYMTKNIRRLGVACKDFTRPGVLLLDFAALKNQVVDSLSGGYDTDIDEILSAIHQQSSIDPVPGSPFGKGPGKGGPAGIGTRWADSSENRSRKGPHPG